GPDGAADRAQPRARHAAVSAGAGDGRRSPAGRGRTRGGARRSPRAGRLSRPVAMNGVTLTVQDLVAGYEPGLPIVRGATREAHAGEIFALLGPNGSGKSTLVGAVAGLVAIESGRVLLGGGDITGRAAHPRGRAGARHVP